MNRVIDAHIHLDLYEPEQVKKLISTCAQAQVDHLITVSMHADSAMKNLEFSNRYERVKAAIGFHPEQPIPGEQELDRLFSIMEQHHERMIAVGEAGLPYYLNQKKSLDYQPYVEVLEQQLVFAKTYNLPVVLHAVYEDSEIVCDLLEKHSIQRAHFHWYKGNQRSIERLISNGYLISFTPDVCYESDIQRLAKQFPMELVMVETDGPWPFEGHFSGELTTPKMVHDSLRTLSVIWGMKIESVYSQIYNNTVAFYQITS